MNKLRIALIATALVLIAGGVESEFTLAFGSAGTAPPAPGVAGFTVLDAPSSDAPTALSAAPGPSVMPAPPVSQRPVQPAPDPTTGGPTVTQPDDPTAPAVPAPAASAESPLPPPPTCTYALDGTLVCAPDPKGQYVSRDGRPYVYDKSQDGYVPAN